MKTTQRYLTILAVLTATLLTTHLAPAAPFEWTGASGVDDLWATGGNWNPSGPPGTPDTAIFAATDVVLDAVTVNNIVGASTTITALSYTNTVSGNWHVTEIPSGSSLTVSGTVTVGGQTGTGAPLLVSQAAMVGGGTLIANGAAFNVGNGAGAGGLNSGTILNLSALTNFFYNSSGGTIGVGAVNRSTATLNLAAGSNYITVGTINLNTGSTSSSGSGVALRFGPGTNNVNVGTMNIGANRTSATAQFTDASGGLRLRGVGGTDADRCSMTLGNRNTGSSSPATTTGTLALNGHPVDLKLGTLTLGAQNRAGTEAGLVGSGVFQFDQGSVDVTSILMAVCNGNSPTAGARGTLTVGASGTLTVGSISMANVTSPGVGANASSTLNILGGLVDCAGNIVKTTGGLSTNTIGIDTGGRLYLGSNGRIGTPALPTDFLNLTNATLQLSPNAAATNVVVTTLTMDGVGNTIDIGLLPSITSYPVTFRLIKYQGVIGGAGYNFTMAGLPGVYTGSLVDNSALSAVDLVITAGPIAQSITWVGTTNSNWNILTTKNWRVGTTSTNYFDGDFVTFDDTAAGTTTVNLTTDLLPGSLTVNNSALNYTFGGSGKLSGLGGLTKQGAGTLVLTNSGVNDFSGNIAINAGTLQVGGGGISGDLGVGAISNNASLTFNRSDDLTVANIISGTAAGTVTKNGAGVLTLSGANTFTGAVTVALGTLKTGNASALGRTNGITTVNSGATIDVNAQNLGAELVVVSGTGVGGNGAIINSGAQQQNALRYLTLTGNTTFGNPGRWDIRGAPSTADPANAGLSTGGNPYKLTKTGTNTVSLVGVTVDSALGDIDVQAGVLGVEAATTGLGNPSSNLVVRAGATLRFFNMTNVLNKQMALNGSGTNITLDNGSGANIVIGPMTLTGDCNFTAGGTSLTLSNTIIGGGNLIKAGTAILTLTGGNDSYSGSTTVSNGTLIVNNTLSGGGTLTTLTNTILGGTGTNTGPVIVGGTLTPGTSAGTFSSGNLTLNSGAVLAFELNSINTMGSGVNDLIQVNGNLIANGNSFTISLLDLSLQVGTYRLINYTGSLIGNLNTNVSLGGASRYTLALNTNTAGQVNLVVGGGGGKLRWDSNASTTWDVTVTSNWFNTVLSAQDAFYQGDTVLFSDADYTGGGPVITTIDIPTGVAVAPSALTNNSSANQFTINGPGKISGGVLIDKTGDSTLTLNSTNDFTGSVIIEQGTVIVGNASALGTAVGGTLVKSGATLDFNGKNIGLEPVTVSGVGVGGAGALVNSGAQVLPAVARVTLAGNTIFGGTGRWDLRSATTSDPSQSSLLTGGLPYKLTKVGGNQVSIVGTTVDPALGDIDVQGGTFSLEVATTGAGNPLSNLTVQAGATLQMFNLAIPLNKRIAFTNANFNNDSGANVIIGPVFLDGICTFDIDGGTSLTISNVVSGAGGGLTKIETGTLTLSGANAYGGDTTVNVGTLGLIGAGSIASSPNIVLASSTTLDVSGRSDATLTLASGQKLFGNGTVLGSLVVGAGTVSPGASAGRLTVTNAVLFSASSTNVMEVDKSAFTNDVISAASITYGGRLQMQALSLPFAAGDSFKLFSASAYSGAFTAIEPATPGAGLVWNTSGLTNGTLTVRPTGPVPPPRIVAFTDSGFDVALSGTNGPPYALYQLLASTNVGLPVSNWTSLRTNYFDGSGNFSEAGIPVDPNDAQRYYLIRIQLP